MIPPAAERSARAYLETADRLLPGRVTAFYIVGSTALGAWTEGRSDIDFVAIIDEPFTSSELRRLRQVHLRSGVRTGLSSLIHGNPPTTGTCNGIYLRAADLTRPMHLIQPEALHIGLGFRTELARPSSSISPVEWKVLSEQGIALRGPPPSELGLDPELDTLVSWNLGNLDEYWRPWAEGVARSPGTWFRLRPSFSTAWGMLGAPRLHRTIATGEVISKEAAGEYALATFDERWHPLLHDALAYRRRTARPRLGLSRAELGRQTGAFVLEVVTSAHEMVGDAAG